MDQASIAGVGFPPQWRRRRVDSGLHPIDACPVCEWSDSLVPDPRFQPAEPDSPDRSVLHDAPIDSVPPVHCRET